MSTTDGMTPWREHADGLLYNARWFRENGQIGRARQLELVAAQLIDLAAGRDGPSAEDGPWAEGYAQRAGLAPEHSDGAIYAAGSKPLPDDCNTWLAQTLASMKQPGEPRGDCPAVEGCNLVRISHTRLANEKHELLARVGELETLLRESIQTIEGLGEQQAMPDPSYEPTLARIRSALTKEVK